MMSDDIRAAAARLRLCLKTELGSDDNPYTESEHRLDADLWLVADAYLAEHRADDGEAVTFDWIQSVGFVLDLDGNDPDNDDGLERWWVWEIKRADDDHIGVRWAISERMEWAVDLLDGDTVMSGLKSESATRGDVRRLCEVLGVELREGGAT